MKKLLYFLTPDKNASPFDVTIAADAGFDMVIPITNIGQSQVTGVVHDAIFCRPPKRFNDMGIFIGGRDMHLATDMFKSAKQALIPPFEVGIFADPNGAYTTSSSIVALVNKVLMQQHNRTLADCKVAVFGTGPVGSCIAVLAAKQGAQVKLCQLMADDDEWSVMYFCERYEANAAWVSAQTNTEKTKQIEDVDVIICAAKAGVRILEGHLNNAEKLLVVADTNAVPPSGVAGVKSQDNGAVVEYKHGSFHSIGPLAIGNLKYKTQLGLLEKIIKASKPVAFDFPEAYEFALALLQKEQAN